MHCSPILYHGFPVLTANSAVAIELGGGGRTESFGVVLTQELEVLAILKRGGGGGGGKKFPLF